MIEAWRKHPHVREWWGDDEPLTDAELARPLVRSWIVSLDQHPFAYIQDYSVHGWDFDHHFADLPKGARGIDLYLADPNMLGQGHGKRFIAQHMATLFAEGAPVIATDPDPNNTHAVGLYVALGFRAYGDVVATDWGPAVLMKCDNSDFVPQSDQVDQQKT